MAAAERGMSASRTLRALLAAGAWAPLAIFLLHVVLDAGLGVYDRWPHGDVPMHLAGGAAMAWFLAGVLRQWPPAGLAAGRMTLAVRLLSVGLTAIVAVAWEVGEFALDRLAGTHLQGGLADTMQDLVLGICGAAVCAALAGGRRNAGASDRR
jgi:hypothetical protein